MTPLENWLQQATLKLAEESAAQVRNEIQQHYESSVSDAIAEGSNELQAGQLAVKSLGDAKAANRQYRKVLLTSSEAKVLRGGKAEASAVCERPWLKRMMLSLPVVGLLVASGLFLVGKNGIARDVLFIALGMTPFLLTPVLSINTQLRSRVYRWVKWTAMAGAVFAHLWTRNAQMVVALDVQFWINRDLGNQAGFHSQEDSGQQVAQASLPLTISSLKIDAVLE